MYLIFKLVYSRYIFRNKWVLAYAALLFGVITYAYFRRIKNDTSSEEVVKWKPGSEEISCHILRQNDGLPLLLRNATFPTKSIFFHETSCRGGLSFRQACVVESAARSHPQHQINVLFTSAVSEDTLQNSVLTTLLATYKNVKIARITITDYASGTPLEGVVKKLQAYRLNEHIAKIVKYLTMYKYSGIYLGLDVIVAQSFDSLWQNWVIRDTPGSLSTDMFSFSENKVGRKLADVAVGFLRTEILLNKENDLWSYSGPSVITHLLELWCTTMLIETMSLSSCDDLAIYGPDLFYPISFHDRQAYFQTADWEAWKEKNIYTYHVWEYFTKYNMVTKFSLYGKIAQEYCPTIYNSYNDQFDLSYP